MVCDEEQMQSHGRVEMSVASEILGLKNLLPSSLTRVNSKRKIPIALSVLDIDHDTGLPKHFTLVSPLLPPSPIAAFHSTHVTKSSMEFGIKRESFSAMSPIVQHQEPSLASVQALLSVGQCGQREGLKGASKLTKWSSSQDYLALRNSLLLQLAPPEHSLLHVSSWPNKSSGLRRTRLEI